MEHLETAARISNHILLSGLLDLSSIVLRIKKDRSVQYYPGILLNFLARKAASTSRLS